MDSRELSEFSNGLKLIAKSSFVVFIGLFLSKLFTYAYRIIIARAFGPEIYGLFVLAIMVLGWFVLFGSLGFSEGLIRYISWYRGKKDDSKIKYIFRITITVSLIAGTISAVLLYFFSEFISINLFNNSNLTIFLKIFSFLVPIYILTNIFLAVLQAFEKIQTYSFLTNIFQNTIKVVFLALFVFIGLGSNSIIFSYFLGYVLILILAYFICKSKTPEIFGISDLDKKTKKQTFSSFYRYSWPLIFVIGIGEIFYWTDTFFIGYFKGATDVGFYNVAVPIAMILTIVPEIFMKLFFPLITREYSQDKKELVKQLSQQIGKWIFVLILPISLIMFLFPGVIISFLFGPDYLPAVQALRILSVGVFFTSVFWVNSNLLLMAGKSKTIFINLIVMSLINVFMNILLIPKYGINGAAFSTAFCKVTLGIILLVEVKSFLSIIPFRRKIFPIFFISLIPTTIVLILREIVTVNIISLVLVGTLFFLTYTLLIFLTNSFDQNDLMILKSVKQRFFQQKNS